MNTEVTQLIDSITKLLLIKLKFSYTIVEILQVLTNYPSFPSMISMLRMVILLFDRSKPFLKLYKLLSKHTISHTCTTVLHDSRNNFKYFFIIFVFLKLVVHELFKVILNLEFLGVI